MSDNPGLGAAAWQGPQGGFGARAQAGKPQPGLAVTSHSSNSAAAGPQQEAAGGGFSVDPEEVVGLADEVGRLPKEALLIRQDLFATLEQLPPVAFGLVAESNDAYMAYRRRVGAANTGFEAADLELQQMSDDIGRSATSYSWQDREVAEDYARLSRRVTSAGTATSPMAP